MSAQDHDDHSRAGLFVCAAVIAGVLVVAAAQAVSASGGLLPVAALVGFVAVVALVCRTWACRVLSTDVDRGRGRASTRNSRAER
ncbi:MAG: hypothetical protein Q8Q02_06160 [Nocardioides sp.]|nr:hypothetical protein [Nocardioides sp.]